MASARTKIRVLREDDTLVAEYLLGEGVHSVGRDPASAIYLDSEYISNDHARLYLGATGIEIEDLNSSTGTFLDGIKVRGKLDIKPGQQIKVGDLLVELTGESAGELGAGSTLGAGRYTLMQELGRGSMGTVWLAKDNELKEEVAIKLLAPELSGDAVTIANLKREVSKSRKLSHNNIIRIHDLSNLPGEVPFITLEYVRGSNMDAVRLYQPDELISWEQLRSVILQLCDALETAHQQKIVHRDLKPANIMVDEEYNVKLADFGIAATINEATARSSMAGLVSGTLHFMSPQQLRGDDPRASDDIYSLGATIYNLLTGHPPFKSGDIQSQITEQIPPSVSQVLEAMGRPNAIPDYVNTIINACLAKEPEDRPQSAKAIKDWITSEGTDKESLPKKPTKTFIRKQRQNRRSGKKTERMCNLVRFSGTRCHRHRCFSPFLW
jgi:serine/threonine protein kinase